jgi:glycosyltransferase involved in cell wall biosynthesis
MSNKPEILLSVLIPSIPKRLPKLAELLACLESQADPQLEVLVMIDNRTRSLGEKRNALIREAHGKFIANIDDDDMLSTDYFKNIAPFLGEDSDVVAYDATCSFDGGRAFRVNTGMDYENEQPKHLQGGGFSDITRKPWHWAAWRRDLALKCKFPEWHDPAEDAYWLMQAWPLVRPKNWRRIEYVGFHHRWSSTESLFDGFDRWPERGNPV